MQNNGLESVSFSAVHPKYFMTLKYGTHNETIQKWTFMEKIVWVMFLFNVLGCLMCANGMLKNNDATFFSLTKLGVVLHIGSVELQLFFMTGHEPNHASQTTIRPHQWNQKEKENSLVQQV